MSTFTRQSCQFSCHRAWRKDGGEVSSLENVYFYEVKLKVSFEDVHFYEVKLKVSFENVHFYEVRLG